MTKQDKKVERKFTMEEAMEELKKKEQDKQARLEEFSQLVQAAMQKTNCSLQIDLESKLNDLRIIPVAND